MATNLDKKKRTGHSWSKSKSITLHSSKAELIHLLHYNNPEDGRKSRREALELINDYNYTFIQKHVYSGSSKEKEEDVVILFARILRVIDLEIIQ